MRQIAVRLKLDKMDKRVIPDLSASADVILESEQAATLAPLAGVFRDGPSAKPYVYMQSAAGWVKHPVELGLQDNIFAVVKSGLKKGEVIALDPPVSEDSAAAKPPSS